jgi:hypothetical protein
MNHFKSYYDYKLKRLTNVNYGEMELLKYLFQIY